jgi:hypothetical protein
MCWGNAHLYIFFVKAQLINEFATVLRSDLTVRNELHTQRGSRDEHTFLWTELVSRTM